MRVVMAAVCGLGFVAACGGDAGEDGRDGQDGTVLASMDLPVGSQQCPAGGILVTIDGAPRALCNGENGDDGASGPAGMTGAPGRDGETSGYRPELLLGCSVALDFYTGGDGIAETFLKYDAVVYSNGDADVSCEVAGGDQEGSSSRYFPLGTVGASELSCSASIDYPPNNDGNAGFMSFGLGAQGPTATYVDAPNPMHMDYFVFEDVHCVVRQWTGSAWVAGALSDL